VKAFPSELQASMPFMTSSTKPAAGNGQGVDGYLTANKSGEAGGFRQCWHDAGLDTPGKELTQADLEEIALYAMRETCHADISMLKHRDLFLPDPKLQLLQGPVTEDGIYQLMAAIFWKGDEVICQNLTGDTIDSVLQTSKQLQNDEDNGLSTELTEGWSVGPGDAWRRSGSTG
jgi:hypothetical protein